MTDARSNCLCDHLPLRLTATRLGSFHKAATRGASRRADNSTRLEPSSGGWREVAVVAVREVETMIVVEGGGGRVISSISSLIW